MATQREEAIVELGLNSSNFQRGFESFAHNFRSGLNNLANQWMGAFSVGGIIAGFSKVIEKFHQIQVQADNLSVGTDFLQGIEHIAKSEVVGGVQKINRALMDLNVKLDEAKNGNKEAIATFEKWGITAGDIASLDTEGMFYRVADATREADKRGVGVAAAFELIGKSGKQMAGFLKEGSGEIKKAIDGVQKLDEAGIRDLAKARQQIEDAENSLTVFGGKAIKLLGSDLPRLLGGMSAGLSHTFDYRLDDVQAEADRVVAVAQKRYRAKLANIKAIKDAAVAAVEAEAQATKKVDNEILQAEEKIRYEKLSTYEKVQESLKKENLLLTLKHMMELTGQEKTKGYSELTLAFLAEEEIYNKNVEKFGKEQADAERKKTEELRKQEAIQQAIRNRFLPSLDELARGGAFGKDARQVKSLDLQIKREFESGNITGANQDIARREKLYDKIFDALNGRTPIPVHPKLKP
jgi:hypothetical protein